METATSQIPSQHQQPTEYFSRAMKNLPHPSQQQGTISGTMPRRGKWSVEEHDRFLHALKLFPDGPWYHLALCIGSRSTRQVQTHAQKYFEKIRRHQRGLQRTYVHNGTVREHRVDDDVIALVAHATETLQQLVQADHDKKSDYWPCNQNEQASENVLSESDASGSPILQTSSCISPVQPSLPRRIRIRRSARNSLRRMRRDDGCILQALLQPETTKDASVEYTLARSNSSGSITAVDEIMLLNEPVLPLSPQARLPPLIPATDQLPTLDEALDFFLSHMNSSVTV